MTGFMDVYFRYARTANNLSAKLNIPEQWSPIGGP